MRELEAKRRFHQKIKNLEEQVCLELQTGIERVRRNREGGRRERERVNLLPENH